MKYVKIRKDLTFILNPLLLLIGLLLFCFLPAAVSAFFYAFWLCTACVLFLIVTPLGNKKLASHAEKTIPHLFFYILLLELTLIGVYVGMCFIAGDAFPINTTPHAHLFLTSLHTALLSLGLFPWSLYALIAVGMGFLAYDKHTNAFFSNLIKPLTKQEPQEAVSVVVNIGARRCTQFAVAIMLLFMTVLLISLVLPPALHIVHGFYPAALLTTLVLLLASFSDTVKHYSNRIFSRRISTAFGFPLFAICVGLALFILGVMISGLLKNTAEQSIPIIITRWIHYHWRMAWQLFSVMWWCSLTPMVAAFIARLSKGHSIRVILISVLILPLIISLFFICQPDIMIISLSPWIIKILSLISFLILLPLLINHRYSSCAILSYFPAGGINKQRDEQPFFQGVVQITLTAFYLYLIIGVNGISLFLFVPNYFMIVSLLMISLAIVKIISRR